jgi:predicted metal-dependent hydrolase
MLRRLLRRRRRPVSQSERKQYELHKEAARARVLARLAYYGHRYDVTWNRVAIRDQRRRWGSCSSKGNLNFNYRLIFLPEHLFDYIIVHELCHLKEMNHGPAFWSLVAKECPQYEAMIAELRVLERTTRLKPEALVVHAVAPRTSSQPVTNSAIITA